MRARHRGCDRYSSRSTHPCRSSSPALRAVLVLNANGCVEDAKLLEAAPKRVCADIDAGYPGTRRELALAEASHGGRYLPDVELYRLEGQSRRGPLRPATTAHSR